MINIRLQRRGRKNDPSYRVIVADSRKKPKTGNYLEMVGSYDPRTNRVELKGERILSWIKNGAKPSATVHNLLVSNKILDAKKINILPAFKAAPAEAPAEAAEATTEVSEATSEAPEAAAVHAESSRVDEAASGAQATVSNDVVEEAPQA